MTTSTIRQLALLALAATAPVALGVAMHVDHDRTRTAAFVPVPMPAVYPVAQVVPIAAPEPAAALPACAPEPELEAEEDDDCDAPTPTPLDADAFAFVLDVGGPVVVLATEVDEAWVAGAPERIDDDSIRRTADLHAIPDALTDRVGAEFHAYGEAGEVCTGKLGAPFLYADALDYAYDLPEEERADAQGWLWENGRRLLVAPLEGVGQCEGALWARATRLPAPVFPTQIEHPTKVQVQAARRAYLRTEALREAAAQFELYSVEIDALVDPITGTLPKLRHRLSSTAYDFGGDGADTVLLGVDGPEFGGCGGFESRWGVAIVGRDGATVREVVHGEGDEPVAIMDIDGDGSPEMLAGPRLGSNEWLLLGIGVDGMEVRAQMSSIPFFGCPC